MLQIKQKERMKLLFALIVMLVGAVVVSGCATPRTSPLETSVEYRFKQDDNTLIAATFSGGGMRAAALAYGALQALKETEKSKNVQTPTPTEKSVLDTCHCYLVDETGLVNNEHSGVNCARTKQTKKSENQRATRLIDEVDFVSAVSGGGVTAAYWALYGPDELHTLKERFLCKNVPVQLFIETVVNPIRWLQLLTPSYSRIDIFRDYLEEEMFEGSTYKKLMVDNNHPKRPYLILNTTDMETGKVFSFTPEMFDFLCADLKKFKLADAVAASAAYPVLLTALTVKNYRPDQECLAALKIEKPMEALEGAQDRELALATAEGGVKAKREALKQAREQKQDLGVALATAEGQVEAKQQALATAKREVRAKTQALATAEKQVKAKRQALEEAERQNQALEVALVGAEGEVKAKRQALEKAKDREQALEVVLAMAKGQVEAKQQALTTAEEWEQRLKVVLVTAEGEVEVRRQALEEAKERGRKEEVALAAAKGQVEAKRQVLAMAEEWEQRMEMALATVEGEVEAKRQALKEAQGQGQNRPLELALATAEGEAKTKRQALEEVKGQNQALELALKTAEKQVEAKKQALENAEKRARARELDMARTKEQIEAKKQALEEAQGQKRAVALDVGMAVGQVKAKTQALEEVKGQNQALELALKTAGEQVEAKKQALEEARGQKRAVELDVGSAQGQKRALEVALAMAKKQVEEKRQDLEEAEKYLEKLKGEVALRDLQTTLSSEFSAQLQDYDNKKTQYVHFLDGGIADNVGLTPLLGLLDPIVASIVDQKNNETNNETKLPKSIAVFVVNARADPPNEYGERDTPPCCIDTLRTTIGTPIDHKSSSLLEKLGLIEKALEKFNPEPKMFIVDVNFDRIKDDKCRRWFHKIPAMWPLEAEQVDALIKIGRALVLDSEDYGELTKKLGYKKPDKTVSEVCQVCKEVIKSSNLHHSLPDSFAKGTVEVF